MPLVTRDCQPRCQHTLTQPSSTPTIRPVYLRRDLGRARHYTACPRTRSTALHLDRSAPLLSMLTCPDYVRDARSPESAPPNAALSGEHTHTGCNGRLDDRTLSQSSLGPNVLCGRDARMQCCLESFCASRLSALRARLCMCAVSDVRHASRRALGCPSRVLPCRSHARREGGCAQTALRVCSLLL